MGASLLTLLLLGCDTPPVESPAQLPVVALDSRTAASSTPPTNATNATSATPPAPQQTSSAVANAARPPLDGVVQRLVPGVTSPALESLAQALGSPLAACLDTGEDSVDVDVVMREGGPELEARAWIRSGRSLGVRSDSKAETCILRQLESVAWPLRPKQRTRLSFSVKPHNAAGDAKGWAFFSVGGALKDRDGFLEWDQEREALVRCGATNLVALYTSSGTLRAFTTGGGRKPCLEALLRKFKVRSNSAGGEFCIALGDKPLRSCPLPSILGSRDEVPGVISLEEQ